VLRFQTPTLRSPQQQAPPKHWTIREFLAYLDAYIAHFGFGDRLRMNARVESARRVGSEGSRKERWEVVVHYKCWETEGPFASPDGGGCVERRERYTCEHLVVATGTHNAWAFPDIPGLDVYRGAYHHSSKFHGLVESGALTGKHVLMVGLGESGCDLVKLAATEAKV